tara:strand:- start:1187 stop:1732 length:546 start_codon:yes stop_codon:yes gene_type:complete
MVAINKDKELLITQELLKERLHYDRETGVFTWLDVKVNAKRMRGKVAGSLLTTGYVQIEFRVNKKRYVFRAHRLAWLYEYGEFPSISLDHINHDRADNRITNLRMATHRENLRNQSMSSSNTTGHSGVSFNKTMNKYQSYIQVDYKKIHLGTFENIEDAAKAAREGREHYGFHVNHGQTND